MKKRLVRRFFYFLSMQGLKFCFEFYIIKYTCVKKDGDLYGRQPGAEYSPATNNPFAGCLFDHRVPYGIHCVT